MLTNFGNALKIKRSLEARGFLDFFQLIHILVLKAEKEREDTKLSEKLGQ